MGANEQHSSIAELADLRIAELADSQNAELADSGIARSTDSKKAKLADSRIAELADSRIAELADLQIAKLAYSRIAKIAFSRISLAHASLCFRDIIPEGVKMLVRKFLVARASRTSIFLHSQKACYKAFKNTFSRTFFQGHFYS